MGVMCDFPGISGVTQNPKPPPTPKPDSDASSAQAQQPTDNPPYVAAVERAVAQYSPPYIAEATPKAVLCGMVDQMGVYRVISADVGNAIPTPRGWSYVFTYKP